MAVAGRSHIPETASLTRWLRRIVVFSGFAVGGYLATMLAWALVPMLLLGWTPLVVVSGSMQPLIRPGDVVLVEPVEAIAAPGTVLAFEDGAGIVVHRVSAVGEGGVYTTRGDANGGPDSATVTHDQVIGEGRLLIPYIGLARMAGWLWWVTAALVTIITLPLWRRRTRFALAAAVVLLIVVGVTAAVAVFSGTTATAASYLETVTVAPPTGLVAECAEPLGVGDAAADLTWTASSAPGLSGYRVYHDAPSVGVNFTEVGSVGPATTQFTHEITLAVLGAGAHTYMVRSEVGSWQSVDSNTDALQVTQVLVVLCQEL